MAESNNPRAEAVAASFDLASDRYDHAVQSQWEITAAGTLAAAALTPGESVLDVCVWTNRVRLIYLRRMLTATEQTSAALEQ